PWDEAIPGHPGADAAQAEPQGDASGFETPHRCGRAEALESCGDHAGAKHELENRAPRGDECLCRPLMAQTYWPQPLLAGMADGTVRLMPGDLEPGYWNAFLHPTGLERTRE